MLKGALTASSQPRSSPHAASAPPGARRARHRRRIGQAQRCVAPHPQTSARAPTVRDSAVTGTAGSKSRSVSPATAESRWPAITIRRCSGPAPLSAAISPSRRASRAMSLSISAPRSRQRVRVVLEPGDGFGGSQGTARRLRVVGGDDPPEFVERAAEPLPILLREFRPLRAEETARRPIANASRRANIAKLRYAARKLSRASAKVIRRIDAAARNGLNAPHRSSALGHGH